MEKVAMLVAVLVCAAVVMVPEVDATRWTVGGNQGWSPNVNYTIWAQDKHFYYDDWLCVTDAPTILFLSGPLCLISSPNSNSNTFTKFKASLFFVYDRNQMNVLEVNKTDYETCNSDHPLHNWTRGAGRDVVHLNETRHYYIISGKGFCFSGMKLAVRVEHLPPPPKAAPVKSASPRPIYSGQFAILVVLATAQIALQFW